MSDLIEFLPFILIAALAFYKKGAKTKTGQEQEESTGSPTSIFDVFESINPKIQKQEKAKVEEIPQHKVTHKVMPSKKIEINKLDNDNTESILPDEVNWQQAVIYSEIFKPKFND